jgi:hypothetical protein
VESVVQYVYNPNDMTGGTQRAYTAYVSDSIYTAELNASNTTSEFWTAVALSSGSDPDVTYRVQGDSLVVYTDYGINSNQGKITDNGYYPNVATESLTKRDIIAGWYRYESSPDRQYILMRELYP